MKNYNLSVVNSNNQNLVLNVYEPETEHEAFQGLYWQINNNQGMVYFPIVDSGSPCINPQWINTHNTPFPVDFVFIKWNGTIAQIDTVPALSDEIHTNPSAMCVIELKAGACNMMNISVGDNVIHNKLHRLPNNRLFVDDIAFTTIKKDSYNQIAANDIIAFAFLYPDIIQIFTTTNAFFIDNVNYDKDMVKHIFPLWEKAKMGELSPDNIGSDWNMYSIYLGQLFVRPDYNKRFVSKFSNINEISKNWAKVLCSLIS